MAGEELGLKDGFCRSNGARNDNFGAIGYVVIGVFTISWIASAAIFKVRALDRVKIAGVSLHSGTRLGVND